MVALGELMATKKQSLDPRKTPERKFALYSIPAYDEGQPAKAMGGDIGSSKQMLQSGDVLLSRIVPHIRRAWIVDADATLPAIGSSEWIVFRGGGFHPPYLRHVLLSDPFHRQFMNTVAGVGGSLLRARPKYVAQIEVPLPPIEEQRRIAAVLDAADELRAKRREALAKLDTLTQAIFINMFGDAAAGKGREMRLVSLAQVVDAPITRGIDQPGPDVEGGVPYLKTTDFRGARPQRENLARSSPDIAAKFPRSVVAAGDSVICIRATVGPTMYMDEELDGVNLSRGTARISPSKEILPKFLFTALNSVHFQRQIERKLRGATFLQIPLKELKQLLVPLPPVPAQQRLVEAVEAVEAQRSSAERSQAFFDDLFASLQKRAFRGEL
jgi:type I restriction enzyme, S subunit